MKTLEHKAYIYNDKNQTACMFIAPGHDWPKLADRFDDWDFTVLDTIAEYEPGVYTIVLSDEELNSCSKLYYELMLVYTGQAFYIYEDNNRNIVDLCSCEYTDVTGLLEPATFIYLIRDSDI